MLDLEHLQQFVLAVQLGSISKAAQQLNLNHTTVSRNISNLEHTLGGRLMTRTSRGVSLTEAGSFLFRHGQSLLDSAEALRRNTMSFTGGRSGTLKIAMQRLNCPVFYTACDAFIRRYPLINLLLSDIVLESPPDSLVRENSDLILALSYMIGEDDRLEKLPLAQDSFCLLISDQHPLARESSVTTHQLHELDIPVMRLKALERIINGESFPSAASLSDADDNVTESMDSAHINVRAGRIAAVLPRSSAEELASGCSLLDITAPGREMPRFDLTLLWHRDSKNPCISLFVEVIRELLNK